MGYKMRQPIDPAQFYTLYAVVVNRFIPGINNMQKASRIVDRLGGKVEKRGIRGMQYQIKGKNIIKYLDEVKRQKAKKRSAKK